MGILSSCNDDNKDSYAPFDHSQSRSNYASAYKSEDSESLTRGAVLKSKIWPNGSTIRIKFLNGSTLAQNKVKEISKEWTGYANIQFEFVAINENADVKISFQWETDRVSWAYIGLDNKTIAQNLPSMNLSLFNQNDSKEIDSPDFKASVLRNFGHVLGLVYENQNPSSAFEWDDMRVRNYFLSQGWKKTDIDKLISVYSTSQTNHTSFDESSIMLLYFPGFLTKNGKGTKFNGELSATDKNLIRSIYPGKAIELPKTLDLEYRQIGDNASYAYHAVRIGEYYWIDNNFYHRVPQKGGVFNAGGEPEITKDMLDTYMMAIHMDLNHKDLPNFPKQVYNIDNFNKYYGRYYNKESLTYMTQYGKMYEGSTVSSNWELPSYVDYRQLFAMCPVNSSGVLNVDDLQITLAARHGDNPATSPYYIEKHDHLIKGELPQLAYRCYDNGDPTKFSLHAVYWNTSGLLSHKPIENTYGFNMMASGARGNNTHGWTNGLYEIVKLNNDGSPMWIHEGQNQYLRQLFYAVYFSTKENCVVIHDDIETNTQPFSWHWYPVRWCKKLTDEELGYKLYINSAQTDIKKLSLTDAVPSGYSELSHGYLRGFYVQYILNNPKPKYTVGDVVKFAKNVPDRAL